MFYLLLFTNFPGGNDTRQDDTASNHRCHPHKFVKQKPRKMKKPASVDQLSAQTRGIHIWMILVVGSYLFCFRSSSRMWLNSGLSVGSSAQQRCISWPSSGLWTWGSTVGLRHGHSPRTTRSTISAEGGSDLRTVYCRHLNQIWRDSLKASLRCPQEVYVRKDKPKTNCIRPLGVAGGNVKRLHPFLEIKESLVQNLHLINWCFAGEGLTLTLSSFVPTSPRFSTPIWKLFYFAFYIDKLRYSR